MAGPALAAGIGAVGSIVGGISSGKGAKKAARIQAQAAAEQRALQERIYNQNSANFRPEIEAGNSATARLMALLGMGEPVDATAILRETPGYQFRMGEALRGVNSNAYARGLGNSGATQRALMETAYGVADLGFNNYLGQVSRVADRGSGAKGALAGVSQNFANNMNQISQNDADTRGNYEMFKSANFGNTLGGLLKAGGTAFGSSYDTPSSPAPQPKWWER